MTSEEPHDELEFNCGHCGEPVKTYWALGEGGLLIGDYDILGDVVFHRVCCDEYLKDFPN